METTKDKMKSAQDSYLTFKLGEEDFAVHVNNVLNILEMTDVTQIPKTPEYMKGVINLRGSVLPVIDTRLKLDMTETEISQNTCIVVIDLELNDEKIYFGSIVDQVEAVHQIPDDKIQPVPELSNNLNTRFLKGITYLDDQFILILDIVKLLSDEDMNNISEIYTEQKENQEG
jgi:purine-binding chemotaxis protein CheW